VERGRLLDGDLLRERVLTPVDLHDAEEVAVLNSLRGWRAAQLSPVPFPAAAQ
jgi:para-aminobenzoate synthetase/4-amino-4-deoxychorismate lyase